ncbi:hypothetical protein PMZ80_007749 [Knufia obscura]|nr:hypothetical protein PMZ80_007749 [Knufia obscura]
MLDTIRDQIEEEEADRQAHLEWVGEIAEMAAKEAVESFERDELEQAAEVVQPKPREETPP